MLMVVMIILLVIALFCGFLVTYNLLKDFINSGGF